MPEKSKPFREYLEEREKFSMTREKTSSSRTCLTLIGSEFVCADVS